MNGVKIRNLIIGKGKPKICVPIVAGKPDELKEALRVLENLKKKPDLVELRADWFEGIFCPEGLQDYLAIVRKRLPDMPVLFTFRTAKEGGEQPVTYEAYEELLLTAAKSGLVDAVDVEAFSFEVPVKQLIDRLHGNGVTVIASNHDFCKTPPKEELVRRLYKMQRMGADIAKIAVMPVCTGDVLTLLGASVQAGEDASMCPVITMSMSEKGMISRLSGEIFHSAVTFASVGKASAPGQVMLEQVETVLDVIHQSM